MRICNPGTMAMTRSPIKSASDVDIARKDVTPPASLFVTARHKRRHDSVTRDDLEDFKDEIRQMFASFQDNLKLSFSNIERNIEFISQQHDEFQNKIKKLEEECKNNQKYIFTLQEQMEELQRVSKLTVFELRNVPQKDKKYKSDLLKYISNISKTINVDLHESDILDIYRLPSRRQLNRPIIIKLRDLYKKDTLIASVKDFNKSNSHRKLNTSHAGIEGKESPIYLGEHLTPTARKLFYLAR